MSKYYKYSGVNIKPKIVITDALGVVIPHATLQEVECKLFMKHHRTPVLTFKKSEGDFIETDPDFLLLPIESAELDTLPAGPIEIQVTHKINDSDFEEGVEIDRNLGVLFNLIEGV